MQWAPPLINNSLNKGLNEIMHIKHLAHSGWHLVTNQYNVSFQYYSYDHSWNYCQAPGTGIAERRRLMMKDVWGHQGTLLVF